MSVPKPLMGFSQIDIATYSLDLGAAYWFAGLGEGLGRHQVRILCDPVAFRPWWPPASGGSERLQIKASKSELLFHPKIWRIHHRTKVTWIITSANISIPESREQRNFFVQLKPNRRLAHMLDGLWDEIRSGKSSFLVLDLDNSDSQVSTAALKKVLLHRIAAVCRPSGRVIISSSAGVSKRLLEEVSSQAKSTRIRVFVSADAERKLPTLGKKQQIELFVRARKGAPDLHGKLLYAQGPAQAILYVGSANFTQKAYSGGNVESGVIIQGRAEVLAPMVARLLSGSWRLAKPSTSGVNEPEDEWDDHGYLRLLSSCVSVDLKSKRIDVDAKAIRPKLRPARLISVEIVRISSTETLGLADAKRGWELRLHADVLDQELLFRISDKGIIRSERLPVAALQFNDSCAEIGKAPLSLADIFHQPHFSKQKTRRKYEGMLGRRANALQSRADVRFPWDSVLNRLTNSWSDNYAREAEEFARSMPQKPSDNKDSRALRAAVIREVVLAVGRRRSR